MKNVIIYEAVLDGVYSSVNKIECSKDFADRFLGDGRYFKTFPKAKKHVLSEMNYHLNQWKQGVAFVKRLDVHSVPSIKKYID